MTALTHQQVIDHLNEELPGFEAQLVKSDHSFTTAFKVRTTLPFGMDMQVDTYALVEDPQRVMRYVDELIHRTRRDAIERLGLQKQIDAIVEAQVAQRVAEARAEWESKGWQKGFEAGYRAGTRPTEGLAAGGGTD